MEKAFKKDEYNNSEPSEEQQYYLQLKNSGNENFKQQNYDEAIKSYTACIDMDVQNTIGYTNRAACYVKLNKPELAEKDCDKALELEPDNIKALFRRGQAKRMMHKYSESLNDLLRIDPRDSVIQKEIDLVKAVKVLRREEPSEEMDKTFKKQEYKNTELSVEHQYLKLNNERNEKFKWHKYKDAIKSYTACIDMDVQKTVGYTNRAACYINLNKPELAEKDCDKALELEPNNTKALFIRDQAKKMMQKYTELKIDPKDTMVQKEIDLVNKDLYRKIATVDVHGAGFGKKKTCQLSIEDQLRLFLAQRGGYAPLKVLAKHLSTIVLETSLPQIEPAQAIKWLRQQKKSFIIIDLQNANNPYALLLIGVSLCHYYQLNSCKNGVSCHRFHLCLDFLNNDGFCKWGHSCKFSHTFFDNASNQAIINRLHFQDLPDDTLQKIVSNSLPHVCDNYNFNPSGCTSVSCAKIHICWDCIEGTCHKGKCSLSLDFSSEHNQTIIKRYNLSRVPLKYLPANMLTSMDTALLKWLEDEEEFNDSSNQPITLYAGQVVQPKSSSIDKIKIITEDKKTKEKKSNVKIGDQRTYSHSNAKSRKQPMTEGQVKDKGSLPNLGIPSLLNLGNIPDKNYQERKLVDQEARPKLNSTPRNSSTSQALNSENNPLVDQGARPKSNPSSGGGPTSRNQKAEEREKDLHLINLIFYNIVSQHQGSVSLQKFIDDHPDNITIKDADLSTWFDKHQHKFLLNKKASGELDSVTVLEPRARICWAYCSQKGCTKLRCDYFHLCRDYVQNTCRFNESCRFNHTLDFDKKKGLIEKLGLQQFTDSEVLTIIKHSVPSLCKEYNEGACLKPDACPQLHICDGFIANNNSFCTNREKCSRSHDLASDREQSILKQFRMGKIQDSLIHKMISPSRRKKFVAQSKGKATSAKLTNPNPPHLHDGENIAICDAYLRKLCLKKNECPEHHWNVPYAWRHKLIGQTKWKAFGSQTTDNLEMNYCNIVDTVSIKSEEIGINGGSKVEIDLDILVASSSETRWSIERLSTTSHAEADPGNKFATSWLWYWQDDDKSWKPYDTNLSDTIEKAFIQKQSVLSFEIGHFKYNLYLEMLRQMNLLTNKCRSVRRRPVYSPRLSREHDQGARSKEKFQPRSSQWTLPSGWTNMSEEDELKFAKLSTFTDEFKRVNQAFLQTMMGKCSIVKVQRVQNPFLWTKFETKKTFMKKKLKDSGKSVEEQLLFHGTSKDTAQAICRQNFDWRLCGKNGTAYGQGTYFARDASYSHNYSSHSETAEGNYEPVFQMFLANVLVGSFTRGQSDLKRPPPLNPHDRISDLYDSCVDSVSSPSIFVVFDADQYYPQYLIEYKKKKYRCSLLPAYSNLFYQTTKSIFLTSPAPTCSE